MDAQQRAQATMRVLERVIAERAWQMDKWGEQDHADAFWLGILTEEVGEVAKAIIDQNQRPLGYQWALVAELVQVAAVAVAWAECVHRGKQPMGMAANGFVEPVNRGPWHYAVKSKLGQGWLDCVGGHRRARVYERQGHAIVAVPNGERCPACGEIAGQEGTRHD